MSRRVVVTGIGLVSSLGIGNEANWTALLGGQSGIAPITRFDVSDFSTQIAGEVKGFDPLQFIEKKDVKKMDIFIQFAVAASQFAVDDSGLQITPANATRVGVFIASGIGGFGTIEREHKALLDGGPRRISPFFIPSAIINLAAGQVSIRFGAKGPNTATCTACSASAHAIGDAYEIIKRNAADVMIAGGSEAAITPMGVGGFGAMRALSTRNDEPGAGQPSVRQGPRRVRHRRGLGRPDSRGARARAGPRRENLRGAHRLRHVGRRVSHDRAARGRRRRRARDGERAPVGGPGARRSAVHQRARHLDAASTTRTRRSPSSAASAITRGSWRCRRPSR